MIRLFKRILHVLKWIPVLWNDYDWDYHFIFPILRFKLYNMGKCFYNNISKGYGWVGDEKAIRELKTCVCLLDRLIEDDYEYEACRNMIDRWGEIQFKETTLDNGGSKLTNFTREKILTKKDKIQAQKDTIREDQRAFDRKKYDIEYLFKIMHRKMLSWWD